MKDSSSIRSIDTYYSKPTCTQQFLILSCFTFFHAWLINLIAWFTSILCLPLSSICFIINSSCIFLKFILKLWMIPAFRGCRCLVVVGGRKWIYTFDNSWTLWLRALSIIGVIIGYSFSFSSFVSLIDSNIR